MKYVVLGLLIIALSACQTLEGPDTEGTLVAGNTLLGTESAAVVSTASAHRTQTVQTLHAAETQIAANSSVNNQILATLAAFMTPTPAVVAGSIADVPAQSQSAMGMDIAAPVAAGAGQGGSAWRFVQTGTTTAVREADGCITASSANFNTATQRIYATAMAFDLRAGTVMRAEWYRGQELVWEDNWTSNADYGGQLCLWFFLTPSYVPFSAGQWSVRLYANDTSLGPPMTFFLSEF